MNFKAFEKQNLLLALTHVDAVKYQRDAVRGEMFDFLIGASLLNTLIANPDFHVTLSHRFHSSRFAIIGNTSLDV